MNAFRYWMAVLLLGSAALFVNLRGNRDVIPQRASLTEFPYSVAGWSGTDQPIDRETLEVLGQGDFLTRIYTRNGEGMPVQLFIGYFASQRTGTAIHSPRHCLPGGGWTFLSSRYQYLGDSGGRRHQVGEYVISNGSTNAFVIYWYQAHGRSIANEYRARLYMLLDAVRLQRTDGALVRVITPISPEETTQSARERAEMLAGQFAGRLGQFIPE